MDNTMNTSNASTTDKRKHLLRLGAIIAVALVVIAGLAFYALSMWPTPKDTPNKTDSSLSKEEKAVKGVSKTIPVSVDSEKNTLFAFIRFNTSEQGDCTLTISNDSYTQKFYNSTKGLGKEHTGCLNWNINTESIPSGEYDVNVVFYGETKTQSYDQKLKVE